MNGNFRSQGYMRPLSIWAVQFALEAETAQNDNEATDKQQIATTNPSEAQYIQAEVVRSATGQTMQYILLASSLTRGTY